MKRPLLRFFSMIGEFYLYYWGLSLLYFLLPMGQTTHLGLKELIQVVFPLSNNMNWYASTYIISLLFIPFIKKIICEGHTDITKNCLLIVLFVFCSILSTFAPNGANPYITNLVYFLYVYCIGYYLRCNPIKWKTSIILSVGSTLLIVLLVLLVYLSTKSSTVMTLLAVKIMGRYSLFSLFFAVLLLSVFTRKTYTLKIINIIASTTLGIYLLHDNLYFRNFIWHGLVHSELVSFQYIPNALLTICFDSLIVMIACIEIDLIRQHTVGKLWNRFAALPLTSKITQILMKKEQLK